VEASRAVSRGKIRAASKSSH